MVSTSDKFEPLSEQKPKPPSCNKTSPSPVHYAYLESAGVRWKQVAKANPPKPQRNDSNPPKLPRNATNATNPSRNASQADVQGFQGRIYGFTLGCLGFWVLGV